LFWVWIARIYAERGWFNFEIKERIVKYVRLKSSPGNRNPARKKTTKNEKKKLFCYLNFYE